MGPQSRHPSALVGYSPMLPSTTGTNLYAGVLRRFHMKYKEPKPPIPSNSGVAIVPDVGRSKYSTTINSSAAAGKR